MGAGASAAALLLLVSGGLGAQQLPFLVLEELWSIRWEPNLDISKIVPDEGGGLVIQSGPWVHLLEGPLDPHLLGNFEVLDVVGLARTDTVVELVDARTGRLVRADRTGRIVSWDPLPPTGAREIVSAALTGCGWVIGLLDPTTGVGELLFLDRGRAPSRRVELSLKPIQMTAAGRFVAASEPRAPYRAAFMACDGVDVVTMDGDGSPPDSDRDAWRPLPPFFATDRMLRTWVDTQSDRRRLASYRLSDGAVVRWTEVDAPITLVAGTCSGLVIGLRRIGDLEIIAFRGSGSDATDRDHGIRCVGAGDHDPEGL